MPSVRRYRESDWPAVWSLLRATFEAGDTYAFLPESTEAEIHAAWVEDPSATYVACAPDGAVLGTYLLKPNQPGLGSAMCEHSQREAVAMGFLAMQFNLVVSTNARAVRLWNKLGGDLTLARAKHDTSSR
jgi:hypothetical protein